MKDLDLVKDDMNMKDCVDNIMMSKRGNHEMRFETMFEISSRYMFNTVQSICYCKYFRVFSNLSIISSFRFTSFFGNTGEYLVMHHLFWQSESSCFLVLFFAN